jgi:hypothetical protein
MKSTHKEKHVDRAQTIPDKLDVLEMRAKELLLLAEHIRKGRTEGPTRKLFPEEKAMIREAYLPILNEMQQAVKINVLTDEPEAALDNTATVRNLLIQIANI